jgi:SAM-dependent methyltransferase
MGEFEEQGALWDDWAPYYNEDSLGPAEPVARGLARLAPQRLALELGIGAGRVAVPLARLGVTVTGLDASAQMLRRLEERRGDLPVRGRIADMAAFTVPKPVPLIYVVSSTFYLLTTPERQMSCLEACARALSADGRVVIEAAVPGGPGLPLRTELLVRGVDERGARLSVVQHDVSAQRLAAQEVRLDGGGVRMRHVTRRYVHAPELDLMAHRAGLRLVGRYGGWELDAYAPGGPQHISVYSLAWDRDGLSLRGR